MALGPEREETRSQRGRLHPRAREALEHCRLLQHHLPHLKDGALGACEAVGDLLSGAFR